jgi:hypothetical protein
VATAELKKGHQLQEADLTKDPKLQDYLEPYLPTKGSRVGKHLEDDIAGGKPVRPRDIAASPPMMPEKYTYIMSVRLRQQPSPVRWKRSWSMAATPQVIDSSGELEVNRGGELIRAKAGDVIYLPKKVFHTPRGPWQL